MVFTRICSRALSCGNCGGPHPSDSHRFLAKPIRSWDLTKEKLKIYWQVDDPEYQAVYRAIVAEAKEVIPKDSEGFSEATINNQSSNISAANHETPINS